MLWAMRIFRFIGAALGWAGLGKPSVSQFQMLGLPMLLFMSEVHLIELKVCVYH